jgi:CBS-domain-containing membrane protein
MSVAVRDLMTTPVVTVRQDTPFKVIVTRMLAARAATVPVIDDAGLVLGVVTARDLVARKAGLVRHRAALAGLRQHGGREEAAASTAGQLMASPAATIRADATTQQAACLMYRHRVTALPVTDAAGRLIGIIGQDDILGTFTRPDEAIYREVTEGVIGRDFMMNPQAFTVIVRQGIVTLAGCPETDEVGHSLAEAVRRVDGVIALPDRLSYQARRRLA